MTSIDKTEERQHNADKPKSFHTHAVPLNMDDIQQDWDEPIVDACLAAKSSVIMRVGALDLGSGTGSFRVREMMNRIAYPLGVHVRAEVNLTDIEASCTDGSDRLTEVVDLPTTGVNTERIWLLEHFADWFNVNLGADSLYHAKATVSQELVEYLGNPTSRHSALRAVKQARRSQESQEGARQGGQSAGGRTLDQAADQGPQEAVVDQLAQEVTDAKAAARGCEPGQATAEDKAKVSAALTSLTRTANQGNRLTVGQAHRHLDLIESRKPLYSPWFSGLASALACAAFVFLLGGGPYDMVGAFVGAGLGQWLRRRMFAHHLNQFFVTFVCVAVAALACVGTLRLIGLFNPVALQHDTAYIGAMLFVIPGFPLITGGLDIAKLDFPSGIQRCCYTLAIILMATLAGWMVAYLVRLNPQGFEPMGLDPWLNAGLRMLAAFVGVWGFSVLFNSPQRMCCTAAVIGAITDTLRLTMTDCGMPPEAAAFLGALLAGLLATAWRSSVRHGFLPPHLGYPRICLTVPSIVIMVPGLYMYQAMFHLGQFDILRALDWGFRAFMVIVCLPIGLAMARVITDKAWRYDV
ncbi:hypothetical protein CRD60_04090 [Bifidobacterium aemilianum]|uniref:Threonine/serine exporter-like N-terminal domain-containing protein n=1 Tax=Bifidobacterium aemilianum TaxID=2493120 RepID=A0A366K7Z1_9BIFI|nr:threonine/serine exporter family protein [Bifidobacterium aemilianum]RBP97784.1 hypothetical protein CRD60_04090 [Bifidobacterium aemilianum]